MLHPSQNELFHCQNLIQPVQLANIWKGYIMKIFPFQLVEIELD